VQLEGISGNRTSICVPIGADSLSFKQRPQRHDAGTLSDQRRNRSTVLVPLDGKTETRLRPVLVYGRARGFNANARYRLKLSSINQDIAQRRFSHQPESRRNRLALLSSADSSHSPENWHTFNQEAATW
jgi:hypothetical protein